jgi:transposase
VRWPCTIRPLFGPRIGILVSDRATVFSFWTMGLRQVCLAHLLRKFVAFSERDGPLGAIGRELLECTRPADLSLDIGR